MRFAKFVCEDNVNMKRLDKVILNTRQVNESDIENNMGVSIGENVNRKRRSVNKKRFKKKFRKIKKIVMFCSTLLV